MLNTIFKAAIVSLALVFMVACSDISNNPEPGKHYDVLDNVVPTLETTPITEAFSLTCGHCRTMESFLPKIKELTQQDIHKTHVTFNQSAQISAFVFYTAVMQLNEMPDQEFMAELFAIAQDGESSEQQKNTAISQAFDQRNLLSPFDLDEAGQEKLLEYVAIADEVMERARIESVPSFIINGKYRVISGGHETVEDMAATINYLLELDK